MDLPLLVWLAALLAGVAFVGTVLAVVVAATLVGIEMACEWAWDRWKARR